MRFVPGPDLPTGGKIVGPGRRSATPTRPAAAAFRIRATARVENVTPRRKGIVVTELPYGVGPEKVIEKIKDLVRAKRLQGIADVNDLTDRTERPAAGHRGEERLHARGRAGAAVPADADGGHLRDQQRRAGRRPAAHAGPARAAAGLRRRTGSTSSARRTRVPPAQGRASGCTWSRACSSRILDIDEVIQLIRSSDDAAQARERLMQRLRPERGAGHLHPRHAAAPADQVRPDRAGDASGTSCTRTDRRADRDPRRRAAAAQRWSPTSWPRWPSGSAPRGAPCCWSPPAPAAAAALAARGADDPCLVLLSSTGLLARDRDRRAAAPGRAGTGQRTTSSISAVRATARGRGRAGHLRRPAACGCRCSTCRRCRRPRPAPNLAGGVPLGALLDLGAGEKALCLAALRRPRRPVWRSAPSRASSSGCCPTTRRNRDGFELIRLRGRRPGGRRGRAGHRRRRSWSSSPPTPSCCASRLPMVRPQGRPAGGMAGIRLADGRAGRVLRGGRSRRRRAGRDHRRVVRRAARHRGRRRQGDAVRPVPGQGPRHRRGALPAVPARARTRCCWPGRARAGAGGRRQRDAGRPARARPAAGRVGHRGRPSRWPPWAARSRAERSGPARPRRPSPHPGAAGPAHPAAGSVPSSTRREGRGGRSTARHEPGGR